MIINNICSPAIIYLGFSITQIIIDIYKMMYNTAFLKFLVSIIFTIILNILCERGLNIISWIIVFIPFVFMTVITSILLVMFGLDPFFGKLNYNIQDFNNDGSIIRQSQNQNPRDILIHSNLNQNNLNQNNLNSISNEFNNPIIPNSNIQNNIINNENQNESNLPINRILDGNKKANKSNQYTELNNTNQLNNRNAQANKNQNTNTDFLINNKLNNNNLNDCFKSCLHHCGKKNNLNDSNHCTYTCKNICNNIDYKTI